MPADPLTRRTRALEALASQVEGEPAPPPEDQLAGLLVELGHAVWQLRRLERELDGAAAAGAGDLGERIRLAVTDVFGEVW